MNDNTAFRNTIKRSQRGDFEYEIVEDGEYVMGLVNIKNCKKKKWESEEEEDAFLLVFRAAERPACFVNIRVTAKWGALSSLYKLTKRMTKNAVTEADTPDEAFAWLMDCLDKWYDCDVVKKVMKNGSPRNFIDDLMVKPAKNRPEKDPCEHFGVVIAKDKTEATGAFEGYPDVGTHCAPETVDEEESECPF